jgi:hypothetical protein
MRTEIIEIDPRKLKLLEINARYMRYEVFQRLVANIQRDGVLTSVPLVAPLGVYAAGDEPERDAAGEIIYEILSGNHRTRAAIAAGLATIHVMVCLDPMPKAQRVALQLSHNELAGEDDPAILKQLYEQLDIDWKQYAALDDKTLATLKEVKIGTLAEASLTFQSLSFLFLPHEAERVKQAFEQARKLTPGDLYLTSFGDYHRLLDTLESIGNAHAVRNASTQLLLLLDLVDRHPEDLRDGWYDEENGRAKHDKTAPLVSLFETAAIPTKQAVIVARALKEARAREISPSDALASWAEVYLASVKEKGNMS